MECSSSTQPEFTLTALVTGYFDGHLCLPDEKYQNPDLVFADVWRSGATLMKINQKRFND